MLPFVYVAFAATHMFPAAACCLFCCCYRHETLLLMGNVAAYFGREYVVYWSGSLVGACVVWLAGWKSLEELEEIGRDGVDGNLTM